MKPRVALGWLLFGLGACDEQPLDYYAPQQVRQQSLEGGPLLVYVNLCEGGCLVRPGFDDARRNTSAIATASVTLSETKLRPDEQDAMVRCLYRVFEPFDMEFVFEEPTDRPYVEAMVGGHPRDLGQMPTIAGVSPMDCRLLEGIINFTFGEVIRRGSFSDFETAGENFCGVIAHETGHTIGLDHAYLCEDLMTYLPRCVDEQSFTRADSACGELAERACACGGDFQNSHLKVLREVGARTTPIDLPPKVRILTPNERDFFHSGEAIWVDATDETRVTAVRVRIGATDLGERTTAPFSFSTPYDLPVGDAWIEAWATNDRGQEGHTDRFVQIKPGRPPFDGGLWDAAGPRPMTPADAGFEDATVSVSKPSDEGCGCSVSGGAHGVWWLLLRRRRR